MQIVECACLHETFRRRQGLKSEMTDLNENGHRVLSDLSLDPLPPGILFYENIDSL